MAKEHHFEVRTVWTGNRGEGTSNYRAYSRDYEIQGTGKATTISGSSAPAFRGDKARYNPEELLIAAISSCHMLWALHFCAEAGIVVTGYTDEASGTMAMNPDGSGQFTEVTLRPRLTLADPARAGEANAVHARAHEFCFIARSVNFPVRVSPEGFP
jgi:organic hydroperoxide reductase OsmC/OhrA